MTHLFSPLSPKHKHLREIVQLHQGEVRIERRSTNQQQKKFSTYPQPKPVYEEDVVNHPSILTFF